MRLKSNTLLAKKSQFGDKRLNARFSKICHQFSQNLNGTIPESAGKRSASQFGPLLRKTNRGCKLHSSLVISVSGVPFGLFKQSAVIRSDASFGKSHHRTREPIEDKESYRWIEHFNDLQEYFAAYPNIELYNICDREGDFYELFAARRVSHAHFIIRSQYSRALKDEPHLCIHDKVANSPVRATFKIEITNRETCKKRKAILELKYCKVHFELRYPNPFQKGLPAVTLWAVQVE